MRALLVVEAYEWVVWIKFQETAFASSPDESKWTTASDPVCSVNVTHALSEILTLVFSCRSIDRRLLFIRILRELPAKVGRVSHCD